MTVRDGGARPGTSVPVASGSGERLAPLVDPSRELTDDEVARYARHLALPGLGPDGQRRLAAARVLVVGAGGLGSPALLYLAAAGIGTLGIVDDDVVDVTNLQRQVAHGQADLGRPKVASARATVAEVNPHVEVVEHPVRLDPDNVLDVLSGYDVVLDGADNFPTRYLVSDAAELLGLPVVWGSIDRFDGQVSVFWGAPRYESADRAAADAPTEGEATDGAAGGSPTRRGVTYRDVFPVPPPPGVVPDCATGGVLGAMCGTVGSVMATEAVKLITGVGDPLLGRLAVYDALAPDWRDLTVRPDPTREPVTELLRGDDAYAAFCGLAPAVPAGGAAVGPDPEVSAAEARTLLTGERPAVLVDVREEWEAQVAPVDGARRVPSGTFLGTTADGPDGAARSALGDLPTDRPVLLVCAVGPRSMRVALVARAEGVDARSVVGGAAALRDA